MHWRLGSTAFGGNRERRLAMEDSCGWDEWLESGLGFWAASRAGFERCERAEGEPAGDGDRGKAGTAEADAAKEVAAAMAAAAEKVSRGK